MLHLHILSFCWPYSFGGHPIIYTFTHGKVGSFASKAATSFPVDVTQMGSGLAPSKSGVFYLHFTSILNTHIYVGHFSK